MENKLTDRLKMKWDGKRINGWLDPTIMSIDFLCYLVHVFCFTNIRNILMEDLSILTRPFSVAFSSSFRYRLCLYLFFTAFVAYGNNNNYSKYVYFPQIQEYFFSHSNIYNTKLFSVLFFAYFIEIEKKMLNNHIHIQSSSINPSTERWTSFQVLHSSSENKICAYASDVNGSSDPTLETERWLKHKWEMIKEIKTTQKNQFNREKKIKLNCTQF